MGTSFSGGKKGTYPSSLSEQGKKKRAGLQFRRRSPNLKNAKLKGGRKDGNKVYILPSGEVVAAH